jgi:hypothetical protein
VVFNPWSTFAGKNMNIHPYFQGKEAHALSLKEFLDLHAKTAQDAGYFYKGLEELLKTSDETKKYKLQQLYSNLKKVIISLLSFGGAVKNLKVS